MPAIKKTELLKSVLEMKFMKRTKERIEKENLNVEDHEKLYSNAISSEMRHASGNYISESSFIYCEDLLEGRLSFKGMNPEIESIMAAHDKPTVTEGEMQKDVSDEMLAKKMKKYLKKRTHSDSPSKYSIVKKKK